MRTKLERKCSVPSGVQDRSIQRILGSQSEAGLGLNTAIAGSPECDGGGSPSCGAPPFWREEIAETYGHGVPVAELFARQVRQTPDRIAVVAPDGVRSYSGLWADAARISTALLRRGAGPDFTVGIVVERSTTTLAAIWGILMAGGAYMPLEPRTPPSYLARQLAECRVSVVLADRRWEWSLPGYEGTFLFLQNLLDGPAGPATFDPAAVLPEHLAYVICTSGSTGAPKPVGVLQGSLINYTLALSKQLRLGEQPSDGPMNFALVSTLAADLGNTCLFPALTSGGCLHLLSADLVLDTQAFADYMARNRIDILKIVPSHLRAMLAGGPKVLPKRWLIVGGETFPADLLEQIQASGARCAVINHYGPTEATVGSLLECAAWPDLSPLAVGMPISHTTAYVLDESMRQAATDIPGELYIGGAGLARGYLFQPDVTADRFVPSPYSEGEGQRLYRTGDRARQLSDSRIQVLGRADNLVKIRGHRIELDEVESVIRRHPLVETAAVAVTEGGDGATRLVAYLVGWSGRLHDSADVRRLLAAELPPAMVPSDFRWVESLPLTPNGKLDRKKLATLAVAEESSAVVPLLPRTPLEETIAGVWSELLGRADVSITDNFFESGGDSIIAIRLAARLRKADIVTTPLQLFKNPTICSLAAEIEGSANGNRHSPRSGGGECVAAEDEYYPLSPLQEGMLFHSLNGGGERLYVSELVCTFREGFDPDAFARAWQRIIDRHTIFRTAFRWDDEPRQIAHSRVTANIDRLDWRDVDPPTQEERLQNYCDEICRRGLDLSAAPLMRLALIRLDRDRYRFVWIYHHLLMDGWSEVILNEELFAHYTAFRDGHECERPAPPPFRAYVDWLRRLDQTKSEQFWRAYLRGFRVPTPVIEAFGGGLSVAGLPAFDMVQLRLSAAESEPLWSFARQRHVTMNTLLQGAWALVLGEYTETDDVVFGATLSGRPAELRGAELIIGPFLNTLPVRVSLRCAFELATWLRRIQRETAEAREFQHTPLVSVQSWSEIPRGTSLFESFIGFQNSSLAQVSAADHTSTLFPIEQRSFRGGWTSYPLSLDVEQDDEVLLTISFDKNRITAASARELLDCLKSALSLIAEGPNASLELVRKLLAARRLEVGARRRESLRDARRTLISGLRRRR